MILDAEWGEERVPRWLWESGKLWHATTEHMKYGGGRHITQNHVKAFEWMARNESIPRGESGALL